MVTSIDPHDTVLVVDDNQTAREALAYLLRSAGYTVLEAAHGADALRLSAEHLDLVVLDVVLPDIDGFEVCRRIKAEPGKAAIPVLMVSGVAVECHDRVHGLDAGADAYLPKPIEPAELIAHARALLRVRHAEAALRQSEEEYRALAESVPHLVWVAGATGDAEYVNSRWQEYTGLPPAAALGRGWETVVHPEDRASVGRWNAAVLAGTPFDAEYRLRRADGVYRWHVGRAQPLRDSDGRAARWFGTCTDVDDHRRAERQSLQAQKLEAVGRLASGVAHDFNNLLTVIGGYAELLQTASGDDSPAVAMAGEIRRATERGATLVRQLLAFSRQQVVDPQPLDLKALVAGMEMMLRRVLGTDVDLATDLRPVPLVKADHGQLEQVVLNLAFNARDAMPTGGRLTIVTDTAELTADDVESYAGYAILAVTDTGTGMTTEVQQHIFEPFFTTKETGRGTGLGLATVHGIVAEAGGHVAVYSVPGDGTSLRIFLPATTETIKRPSEPGPAMTPRGAETVLLVEDEPAVRALAAGMLRSFGYTVLEASQGDEALAVSDAHRGPVDLLVTDVVMPGMRGPEVAHRLRVRRPGVRVLFVSGYGGDMMAPLGTRVDFLQKPFTADDLARRVRKALDRPAR
jgi:two-component system cell cycle sensor histidine kinase/response regulator CckA